MIRLLTTLLLAVVLSGCGRGKSSSIIPVEADDAEMNAAMRTAREEFPKFWEEVTADRKRKIPVLEGSLVKARFADTTKPKEVEHMWVGDIEYDGQTISGTLVDTPDHIRGVKNGEKVTFPMERLSDWLYVKDGKAFGAFTVKLLRKRMSDAERREHDSGYPFRFE